MACYQKQPTPFNLNIFTKSVTLRAEKLVELGMQQVAIPENLQIVAQYLHGKQLHLTLYLPESSDFRLNIYNVAGSRVWSKHGKKGAGIHSLYLQDNFMICKGVYTIILDQSNHRSAITLLVI